MPQCNKSFNIFSCDSSSISHNVGLSVGWSVCLSVGLSVCRSVSQQRVLQMCYVLGQQSSVAIVHTKVVICSCVYKSKQLQKCMKNCRLPQCSNVLLIRCNCTSAYKSYSSAKNVFNCRSANISYLLQQCKQKLSFAIVQTKVVSYKLCTQKLSQL